MSLLAFGAVCLVLGSFGCSPAEKSAAPDEQEKTGMPPSETVEEGPTPDADARQALDAAVGSLPEVPQPDEYAPLSEGIAARYTFSSLSDSGGIPDVSGNGHDLEIIRRNEDATAELGPSPTGHAFRTCSEAYAATEDSAIAKMLGSAPMTLAVRFRVAEGEFKQFAPLAGWADRHAQLVLRLNSGSGRRGLLFRVMNRLGGSNIEYLAAHFRNPSSESIDDGDWHWAVAVREPGKEIRLYVDGVLSAAAPDDGADLAIDLPLRIGIAACALDEVILWERALPPSLAEEVMRSGIPVTEMESTGN